MIPLPPVTSPSNPDTVLIHQSLTGDARAFENLVQRYQGQIFGYVCRLLADRPNARDEAEELTQEVFLRMYRHLNRFDTSRALAPWLFKIATNLARSTFRKAAAHPQEAALDELLETGIEFASATEPVERYDMLSDRFSAQVIETALGRLDARYREVLLLRYTHGLSYEGIAEATETPLNTVRTWLRRGRDRLRQELLALEVSREHALPDELNVAQKLPL